MISSVAIAPELPMSELYKPGVASNSMASSRYFGSRRVTRSHPLTDHNDTLPCVLSLTPEGSQFRYVHIHPIPLGLAMWGF